MAQPRGSTVCLGICSHGVVMCGLRNFSKSVYCWIVVLDAQTQNGDEPVGEYSFSGQSCLSSADS